MIQRNKWGYPIIVPQASHDATIIPHSSHKYPTPEVIQGMANTTLEIAQAQDKKHGRVVVQPKPWYQEMWEKSVGIVGWPL